ncbi:type II toxin-antitoxin system VapC family toxin [Caulobacter segnis]
MLDTHALVWWMAAPERLSQQAHDRITDKSTPLFVSAASVYEIEYKRERDELLYRLPRDLPQIVPMEGFRWLSIDAADALEAAELSDQHRDPWDRIIAAQARRRGFDLITADKILAQACLEWRTSTVW